MKLYKNTKTLGKGKYTITLEDSDEDFVDETPPKKFKLLPSKKAAKKRVS